MAITSEINPSSIEAIASSFAAVFLAEIGDRTFFIIAILAMKNSRSAVFFGNQLTESVIAIIAAFIGAAAVKLIDPLYIQIASCVMFLVYAILSFYEAYHGESEMVDEKNDPLLADSEQRMSWMKVFWKTAVMVFFAEWGDKSNTTIISLSALSNPVLVMIGAIIGFALIGLIGVLVGKLISKYISEKTVKIAAGVLFLVFAGLALLMIFYGYEL